jgi:uncharacterized protein
VRASAIVCFVFALSGACDPPIQEPVPSPRGTSGWRGEDAAPGGDPTAAVASSSSGAKSGQRPTTGDRCMRPSPEVPARRLERDGGADPACPADPEGNYKLRKGRVVFVESTVEGEKPTATVEIAAGGPERTRGLMFRKEMPEDQGMIFRFEKRSVQRFWMHNTCIPLDMLFIDDDGTIVGIEENVPTLNDNTYTCGCPSTYVLEMNAGWSRRHGVLAGQRVRLEGI